MRAASAVQVSRVAFAIAAVLAMALAMGVGPALGAPAIGGFEPTVLLTGTDPATDPVPAARPASSSHALPTELSAAWEPTVSVSKSPDKVIIAEWDEDATPNGNIIAGWITSTGGIGCGFKTSKDGGKTWEPAFYTPAGSSGGDPVIIPDRSQPGTVYISCIYQKSGTYDGIAKSTDDGVTWSNWDAGVGWGNPDTFDYMMLVARGGKMVMAYNNGQADSNAILSNDEGKTWNSNKKLGSGWPNCIEEGKTPDMVYVISGNYGQSIQFHKSTDFGKTWTNGGSIGTSSGSRLSCATDYNTGDIYAVTETSSAVTVIHSGDDGATFDTHAVHSGSGLGDMGSAAYASLGVDGTGAVHVAFLSNEGGARTAYYSKSTDKGATWSPVEKISDISNSGSGRIAHYGHGVAIVGARVCFGFVISVGSANEYRHTCNGVGGGGGASLKEIRVTPNPATVAADATQQFTAVGIDTNGNQTAITPQWASTDGTVTQQGMYTPGGKVGAYEVSAKVNNIVGKATVNVVAGKLASIVVDPSGATVTADATQQFTAKGKDAKGNDVPLTSPQWSTSGGSIDGSGLYTPDKAGSFDVKASEGGVDGIAQITVTAGKPVKLVIDPATSTVRADETKAFKALATDTKGNGVAVTATWTIDDTAKGGGVAPNGMYTPKTVGQYTITATASGMTATASVTVTPGKLAKVVLDPKTASLDLGQTVTFTLKATDSKDNEVTPESVEWSVIAGVGEVSEGKFTAKKSGTGKVSAKATGEGVTKTADASVTVRDNPFASIGFASMWDFFQFLIILIIVLVAVVIAVSIVRKKLKKKQQPGYGPDGYPVPFEGDQWQQGPQAPPPQW